MKCPHCNQSIYNEDKHINEVRGAVFNYFRSKPYTNTGDVLFFPAFNEQFLSELSLLSREKVKETLNKLVNEGILKENNENYYITREGIEIIFSLN